MPELPEVETAVRELQPQLVGRVLRRAWAKIPRQLGKMTAKQLANRVADKRIVNVTRRGKYILIELDSGLLLAHLRMTGRLFVAPTEHRPHEHVRAGFTLDDETESLYFKDVRTLGTLRFFERADSAPELRALGWEPLTTAITGDMLKAKLKSRKQAIKPVLLDQSLWAGIGNIYASEVCWVAAIDPRTPAGRLTTAQCERLCEAVPEVLSRALERGGSTLRDFMSPDGKYGAYQREFRVYDREDDPCLRCGAQIRKLVQAQRSTYFCAKCQRKR